jgi:hypothetical protein
MDLAFSLTRLRLNAEAIAALARGVTSEQACWKPSPGE